jgi:hypothetical protein
VASMIDEFTVSTGLGTTELSSLDISPHHLYCDFLSHGHVTKSRHSDWYPTFRKNGISDQEEHLLQCLYLVFLKGGN